MKYRAPLAVLVTLLLATPSFAHTVAAVAPARLFGGAPALIISGASALTGSLSTPLPAPLALTPAQALSAIVPSPIAVAPVSAALNGAKTLTGALAAAAGQGKDQAPALSAAFDGRETAPTPDEVSVQSAPTPEAFVLEARRRFAALRRAEADDSARPEGAIPSDEDMHGRLDRLPSTNPERMKFIVDLFRLGGAKDSDIVFQDAGEGRNNVIVTKKGRTDRVIVVGGHYDKVRAGQGKIDNGTGSTMVANLYQALNGVDTDATIVFIGFAREEEGLYGSAAYVKSLNKAQRGKIDAMINLDTLAVNGTYSWGNNSTPALLARFAQVARESGRALTQQDFEGGDADSSSFRRAGVPAVTIYGDGKDTIFDDIHNERDSMAIFSLAHYKNAYLLALDAIRSLDRAPLGPVGRAGI